jgi:RsiW-degrading membrane proteinase PrsW (M82 family)
MNPFLAVVAMATLAGAAVGVARRRFDLAYAGIAVSGAAYALVNHRIHDGMFEVISGVLVCLVSAACSLAIVADRRRQQHQSS